MNIIGVGAAALIKLFSVAPSPQIVEAKRQAEHVEQAAADFARHKDVLGNLIREMKGREAHKPIRKRTRK